MEAEHPLASVPVVAGAPAAAPSTAAGPAAASPGLALTPDRARRVRRFGPWVLLALAALLLAAQLPSGLWQPWETRLAEQAGALPDGASATARSADDAGAPAPWLLLELTRVAAAWFGPGELALRLPVALLALVLFAVLLWPGRRRWGNAVTALAALALLACPHFLLQAGRLLGNLPLLVGQGVLLLLALTSRPLPGAAASRSGLRSAALALGGLAAACLSWLAGGLLGLALPLAVLGAGWLLDRRDRGLGLWAAGTATVLLVAGLLALLVPGGAPPGWLPDWSLLLAPSTAPPTFERLAHHLAVGLFPVSLLVPAAAVALLRPPPGGAVAVTAISFGDDPDRAAAQAEARALDGPLLLLWLGLGFVLSSVALRLGQPPLLSALPAVALAVGFLALRRPTGGVGSRVFLVILLVALATFADLLARSPGIWLAGPLGEATVPWPDGLRPSPAWRLGSWALVALLVVYVLRPSHWPPPLAGRSGRLARGLQRLARLRPGFARFERPDRAVPLAAAVLLVTTVALVVVTLPGLTSSFSERGLLDAWQRLGGGRGQLFVQLPPSESSSYYLGRLPRLAGQAELTQRLATASPVGAIVARDRLAELDSAQRDRNARHLVVLDDASSRLLLVSNQLPPGAQDRNPLLALLSPQPPTPAHPLGVRLDGGALELIGADFSSDSVRLGGRVTITTYYRVLRPLSRNWKVFLHVETPTHRLDTGRTDHDPTGGLFPTSSWRVGDIVADRFLLKVPLFSPAGTYSLRAGLFLGEDRMKVDDPAKHDGKNRLLLGTLRVRVL